jgi:hypothetical protein
MTFATMGAKPSMFQYTTNIFTFTGYDTEVPAVLTIIPVNWTQNLM